MSLTIGVDVGGTKVAAGVVDEEGRILERIGRLTPARDQVKTAETICEVIVELAGRHDVAAVGLGAAGFVDESRATVRFAPNLAWREEPLKRRVEDMVGLPVVVENDANAGAWGEARFGAGRGEENLVCVTIGTGIGGGLILGGRLYRGRWGMGGEVGHFRVVPDGRLCGCGNRGCWERYASGSALGLEAKALGMTESGAQITEAAAAGRRDALTAFGVVGSWIGQGLADLAALLDPGCFVIGGGVSAAGDILLLPVREAFATRLTGRAHRTLAEIRLAELGPDAGLVGAADLARSG
ncbi:ROK family glucokinase [Rhizohabitans arisaemae]|uniref:ROK family glucokinase n=1 Tax=Rhizohabitans arisaemae TaxID=2720610 RepID=UPI0024B102CE|nr:ROK family glucokinase [Rhizohabitans arisaemae]